MSPLGGGVSTRAAAAPAPLPDWTTVTVRSRETIAIVNLNTKLPQSFDPLRRGYRHTFKRYRTGKSALFSSKTRLVFVCSWSVEDGIRPQRSRRGQGLGSEQRLSSLVSVNMSVFARAEDKSDAAMERWRTIHCDINTVQRRYNVTFEAFDVSQIHCNKDALY